MKKIISSILAASFILATCAINVMAAPATRKVSVSATPNTDVKAGDKITVTVKIDSDLLITGAGYELTFDKDVFSIDTTENVDTGAPNFVDVVYYNTITTRSASAWKKYMSDPTIAYGDNYIMSAWSGNKGGIPEADAGTDTVIGVYYLTVKDGVSVSSTTLSLSNFGMLSGGESAKDTVTTEPFTVNFKSAEPTVTPWEVTITEQSPAADAPAYTGYIWKLDVTPHDGDLTKFDVKFTDDKDETFDRSILSATKDALNWNAATSFFVGLYTTKHTGVTPTWDVESTKDGKVIKANIK